MKRYKDAHSFTHSFIHSLLNSLLNLVARGILLRDQTPPLLGSHLSQSRNQSPCNGLRGMISKGSPPLGSPPLISTTLASWLLLFTHWQALASAVYIYHYLCLERCSVTRILPALTSCKSLNAAVSGIFLSSLYFISYPSPSTPNPLYSTCIYISLKFSPQHLLPSKALYICLSIYISENLRDIRAGILIDFVHFLAVQPYKSHVISMPRFPRLSSADDCSHNRTTSQGCVRTPRQDM